VTLTIEQLTKAYMKGKMERQKKGEKRFREITRWTYEQAVLKELSRHLKWDEMTEEEWNWLFPEPHWLFVSWLTLPTPLVIRKNLCP
jgi:hypothetical protein